MRSETTAQINRVTQSPDWIPIAIDGRSYYVGGLEIKRKQRLNSVDNVYLKLKVSEDLSISMGDLFRYD